MTQSSRQTGHCLSATPCAREADMRRDVARRASGGERDNDTADGGRMIHNGGFKMFTVCDKE